ncbi:MAG: LamG domain-containing protein [Lentisphaerae bacterium]|nr:LamG domain-containing protein [Lentisphaerota bacterium]
MNTKRLTGIWIPLAVWAAVAPAALVGHWTFDETALSNGNTVAATVGAAGTFASGGDTELHSVEGVAGNAVSLDGNDSVDLSANVGTLGGLTSGSIAFWFKQAPSHGFGTFFSGSDAGDESSELRVWPLSTGGTLGYGARNDGVTLFEERTDTGGYNDGVWHHVAAVSTGPDVALYLDGNLQANETTAGSGFFADVDNLDTILVGANDDSGGGLQWYYTGLVDDLRIYDHALSADEVAALAVILRGHWTFDETGLSDGDTVSATVGADGTFESGGDADSHTAQGVWNRAVRLDGNDYVDLSANAASLGGLKTGSIAFWFKAEDAANVAAFVSGSDVSDASSELRVFIYNSNGWVAYAARNDGVTLFQQFSNTTGWDSNVWHHAVAVSTASDVLLYMNGVQQTTGIGHVAGAGFFGSVADLDTILVGANDDIGVGVEWSYTGLIDDLRIYQGSLSPVLVQELAARPVSGSLVVIR